MRKRREGTMSIRIRPSFYGSAPHVHHIEHEGHVAWRIKVRKPWIQLDVQNAQGAWHSNDASSVHCHDYNVAVVIIMIMMIVVSLDDDTRMRRSSILSSLFFVLPFFLGLCNTRQNVVAIQKFEQHGIIHQKPKAPMPYPKTNCLWWFFWFMIILIVMIHLCALSLHRISIIVRLFFFHHYAPSDSSVSPHPPLGAQYGRRGRRR